MPLQHLELIGGAPLTGKTTLARRLAKTSHATALSTDNIRDWIRYLGNAHDYPRLMSNRYNTPQDYYRVFNTPAKALQEEIDQGREIEKGIRAILQSNVPWTTLVLEGIAVTPQLVVDLKQEYPHLLITPTFLYDDNPKRIKRRIYERGLWAEAKDYSDDVKPMEVEWTILYNQWYLEQARAHSFEITKVTE